MSAGAIIMMCIGCGALWGGFAVASTIGIKHLRQEKKLAEKKTSENKSE